MLDGQPVTLALRPEKVRISKDKPKAVNAYPGKVIDIAYLGNISTYHVQLTPDLLIKSQTANTDRVTEQSITWDEDVWISFASDAGVVLER